MRTIRERAMAIDGLIILDSTNVKPIVQTSFRSFSPAYPLLHIDAYSTALEKATRTEDIDPVLLVNLPESPTACCHLQHRSLTFLCPISGDREFVRCHLTYAYMRSFPRHVTTSRPTICLCIHPHLFGNPHRILRRGHGTDAQRQF